MPHAFDEQSAKRIARVVRQVERQSKGGEVGLPANEPVRTGIVGVVRVVAGPRVQGLWPAAQLRVGEHATTTGTPGPSTSTTTPGPGTTTLSPYCTRFQYLGDGTQDCWLALADTDASPTRPGDVHIGFSAGPVFDDGFSVFVKSDGACPTTAPPTEECSGVCRWVHDVDTGYWKKSAQTCSTGCVCLEPRFCPSLTCEDTLTYCASAPGPPQPVCGFATSTTTTASPGPGPTTTSTTTTAAPLPDDCNPVCFWRWISNGWANIISCGGSCYCDEPPEYSGIPDCASVTTPCKPIVIDPPPPPFCDGSCKFIYDADFGRWVGVPSSGCSSNLNSCRCVSPSAPGSPCGIVFTPCVVEDPGECPPCGCYCGSTTTSTPPPTSCTGGCTWKWDGEDWQVIATNCPSFCGCYFVPPIDGISTCQTANTPCSASTTTSTTTTCAPTTTTVPPVCKKCKVKWTPLFPSGGFWDVIDTQCAANCKCAVPTSAGNAGCDNTRWIACTADCTSTTTPCPTTTTQGPPACGTCCWTVQYGPPDGGCLTYQWVNTSFGCNCPGSSCVPMSECVPPTPGLTVCRNCSGSAPTTTTTSSTTTTTESCNPTDPPEATTTTTPPPYCGGEPNGSCCGACSWAWLPAGYWALASPCGGTGGGVYDCSCPSPPAGLGCEDQQVAFACSASATTTTTTTSTTAGPCGNCQYTYFATIGWIKTSDLCTGVCTCPGAPAGVGTPGQVQEWGCDGFV